MIMDVVLMILLVSALGFGYRLNLRLKALKEGQDAFGRAVASLDQSALLAHQSLSELRADAEETQDILHGRIMAGRELLAQLQSQTRLMEQRLIEAERLAKAQISLAPVPQMAQNSRHELEAQAMPKPDLRQTLDQLKTKLRQDEARQIEGHRQNAFEPVLQQDQRYQDPRHQRQSEQTNADHGALAPRPVDPRLNDPRLLARRTLNANTLRTRALTEPQQASPVDSPLGPQDQALDTDKVLATDRVVDSLNEMMRVLSKPVRRSHPADSELFGESQASAQRRPTKP